MDEVDECDASRFEHPPVTFGEATKRMARAVGRPVVRLDFHQAAANDRSIGPPTAERATEEVARNDERGAHVKRLGQTA